MVRRTVAAVQPRKPTNDAEAICAAAQRPNRRFVPVKSEETQGAAAVFRVRDLLIRKRTQTINASCRRHAFGATRGHLTEFSEAVPQGPWNARRLVALIEAPDVDLPDAARAVLQVLVEDLRHLDERIAGLDAEIARRAREDETARRLMRRSPASAR